MCFSATASFVTAGATGAIGVVCLVRTTDRREMALAAIPALFALQQSVEGLLWLTLPAAPADGGATGLTLVFLLIAEVFWPIYAPLAAILVETDPRRRAAIALCLAAGVGVALTMLWSILSTPHTAAIVGHHLAYLTEREPTATVGLGYLAATGVSLLLSSRRAVALLGILVLAGSVAAFILYWDAFVSVWCFFAAAASLVILGHFEWRYRHLTADA